MSEEPFPGEVQANLERARESMQTARELLGLGHADFAASRAYYAAFYAATAVLAHRGLKFSKHKGVITAVHKDLVQGGELSPEMGKALNRLFRLRGTGDYGGTKHVAEDDAREAVELADSFVEDALRLIPDA